MILVGFIILVFVSVVMVGIRAERVRSFERQQTHPRLPAPTIDVDGHVIELEPIDDEGDDDEDDHPARVLDESDDTAWMQTYSGRKFWPLTPRAKDVELADVAHGLAMTCRYGGHSRLFYSVAEHCILVSQFVEIHARNANRSAADVRRLAQLALMHDSAEAYIGDMIRPLKHQPEMHEFRRAEGAIEAEIAEAFHLQWSDDAHEIVKRIDDRILVDEIEYLMPNPEMYIRPWLRDLSPLGATFRCMPPAEAQMAFLDRYRELFS